MPDLKPIIEQAWDNRATASFSSDALIRQAVSKTIEDLDAGLIRVAEPLPDHPEAPAFQRIAQDF